MSSTNHKIACLGPEGSFSHEFAKSRFPDGVFVCVDGDFEDVLAKLQDDSCRHAVIPFLNSNGIDVRPAQAALGKNREWIHVEGCHPHLVRHNVIVTDRFRELKRLHSKEQVFPQCSDWLRQWQEIDLIPAASTSAALKELLAASPDVQKTSGAICNTLAHELYGGRMLYPKIENPRNTTLFLVISKNDVPWDADQLLLCVTCPTENCYKQAIGDFAEVGFPLMFTSLKGEFSEILPCFLQFRNTGKREELDRLLSAPHRTLIGSYGTGSSLSACVAGFFEEEY